MTAKELAERLDGRGYGGEIYPDEEKIAKESGLVVVFGFSDDNVELRGAIDAEIGAWEGATVYITKSGVLYDPSPDCASVECPYLKAARAAAKVIRAVWGAGDISWTFDTDIPYETFNIYERGELFCVGIVFDLHNM